MLGSVVVSFLACVRTNQPSGGAASLLALPKEKAGRVDDGRFRVVFAGPQGVAASVSEVSLVFSRPLRPLELAETQSAPPVTFQPSIAGRWQWVGTSALLFVPERGRLPGATHTVVEVPAATRALDGTQLGEAYRFEFETPRPKLVRSEPWSGATGLLPTTEIDLYFNQPIDPALFARHARLRGTQAGRARDLAVDVSRPDADNPKRVHVKPKSALPIHTSYELAVDASLTGLEGPLESGAPSSVSFETYGPLVVRGLECDHDTPDKRCAPGSALSFEFSTPVHLADVRRLLTLTPAVDLRWDDSSDGDPKATTNYVYVYGKFRPATSYRVSIQGGLTDEYGQKLGATFSRTMAFGDYWPTVAIGVDGNVLESATSRALPIAAINVPQYELASASLTPADALRLGEITSSVDLFQAVSGLRGATHSTVKPGAASNAISRRDVDPNAILGGAAAHGIFAVGARYDNPRWGDARTEEDVRLVQRTDLALTAKLSRHGSLAWVTRLSNGAPVAGANVELLVRDQAQRRYVTDANGIAMIPDSDYAPNLEGDDPSMHALLIASAGGDTSYQRVSDFVSPWRFGVPVDLSGTLSSYGLMFTERGIYRPGDAVEVKAIARTQTREGSTVPAGLHVQLVLTSPEGEETQVLERTVSRYGSFSGEFRLPRTASLGQWSVAARGFEQGELRTSLEVAEYRPVEFKVAVEGDRREYQRGDKSRWTARADYLFGAPMAGAKVRYSLSHRATWVSVPDSDGFVTDASAFYADLQDQSLDAGSIASGEATLDAQGSWAFDGALAAVAQKGPELVTAEADVTDVSRQSVAAQSSVIVHPATFYAALKQPEDWFVRTGAPVVAEALALTPTGKRVAGQALELTLVKRRWTLVREQAGDAHHSVSKPVDDVVARCQVKTAASPVSCPLAVKEGGYYIVRATGTDAHGNHSEAAFGLYAIGAAPPVWRDRDDAQLELVPNKKQYRVGDTAEILVKSPFPRAEALVTVERAGIHHVERVSLKGAMPTVRVPITSELRPNAFVAVHLVRPRTAPPPAAGTKPDIGAPAYRMGYAELKVDPEARRLRVEVTPNRTDFRPGQEVDVSLAVRDAQGRPTPGELTVWAVDEGVLSLIGYEVPDPIAAFNVPRPLSVATLETRTALAKIGLGDLEARLGLNKGMDGGGGGISARQDFRQSAFYDPSVITDGAGRAHVKFKLPESLTTFRLMAVAVTDGDQYGAGTSKVTTSKPLMARPALPRFVRAGDDFEAGIVVSSKGFGPGSVRVRARIEGLALVGDAERRIDLPKDASQEIRFRLRADRTGSAKLRFDVDSGDERDAVEVTRTVAPPLSPETVALYGQTDDAHARERLGDLSAMRPDVGGLDVSVASTALVGLGGGLEQLIEYPYGCTEQLSSRLLPLVPLRDLAREFSVPMPAGVDGVVERTVAEIVSRQRPDGGFALWPESQDSLPWVSSYALFTLKQASRHGVKVPAGVLARGGQYLHAYLQNPSSEVYLPNAAFVVDVLAELGTPDPATESQLFEKRKELPLFARALLLHALVVTPHVKSDLAAFRREVENQLRVSANSASAVENLGDDYAELFDSDVRTSALVLRALLAVDKAHPLASKLARGLLEARRDGVWESTQAAAFALLALDAYRRDQEASAPSFDAHVLLGSERVLDASWHGRSLDVKRGFVPASKVAGRSGAELAFDKDGSGTLFFETRLHYAPKKLPDAPLDRGMYVYKTLRRAAPADLARLLATAPDHAETRFSGGDIVLGDLVVVTPSPRDFVVIDDPLPAGFEAIDANLKTTAGDLDVESAEAAGEGCTTCDPTDEDAAANGRAFLTSWYRRELRDDRALFFVDHMQAGMYRYRYLARATTPGRFVVPPTRASEMYHPEVFGRTGAGALEIR